MIDEAHALGQADAEPVKKCGLSDIGLRDAAQADLTVAGGRQHDVVGLNACEFFEHSARRVSEASTALPHLQGLPEHESQKAHQDVSLDAIGTLVPDRAYLELILLNAKGRFGLGELDVSLPQLFVAPISDVGA